MGPYKVLIQNQKTFAVDLKKGTISMVYLIIIAILCLLLVLFGIYHMFCMKKSAEFAAETLQRLEQAYQQNVKLSDGYSELVNQYAERLDLHAKNLDELSNKNKQLNEEIYGLSGELDSERIKNKQQEEYINILETQNQALNLKLFNKTISENKEAGFEIRDDGLIRKETTDGTEE